MAGALRLGFGSPTTTGEDILHQGLQLQHHYPDNGLLNGEHQLGPVSTCEVAGVRSKMQTDPSRMSFRGAPAWNQARGSPVTQRLARNCPSASISAMTRTLFAVYEPKVLFTWLRLR